MHFSRFRTTWKKSQRQERPQSSNPAVRCETRTRLKQLTVSGWRWSSPVCGTSGTKSFPDSNPGTIGLRGYRAWKHGDSYEKGKWNPGWPLAFAIASYGFGAKDVSSP